MNPSKAFSTRYEAAKQWRSAIRPLIEEAYRFCAPDRERDFSSMSKSIPETDTYHSLGEECASDLAGDLVTYFTPSYASWFSAVVTSDVPEDLEDEVLDLVTEREEALQTMISASNYYDIAPQVGFEAAAHGTPAMWVDKGHLAQPMYVEAVPPNELLVTPGYMGILDRFREKMVCAEHLAALFDGSPVDLSDPRLQNKIRKPGSLCKVCWGFWVDWADPGFPKWRMEITVDDRRVTAEAVDLGPLAGSCPLLVGRFNPRPGRPWGRGPGLRALPDLRVLDKIEETVLLGLEDALKTTLIYPGDAMIDFSDGIVAGRAYAAGRHFDRNSVYELNKTTNLEVGFFSEESLERRIRGHFYQDGPRQRGDTPPTAAQWFDEARRIQERLGKPSAPLWTELYLPFVQRVEWLGIAQGALQEAIMLQGEAVSVQLESPLQKAQNRDQVMIARSNLELGFSVMQDQTGSVVDLVGTFQNLVKASGDKLTIIHKEQQVAPAEPPAG
jgi:hypothetical protein